MQINDKNPTQTRKSTQRKTKGNSEMRRTGKTCTNSRRKLSSNINKTTKGLLWSRLTEIGFLDFRKKSGLGRVQLDGSGREGET